MEIQWPLILFTFFNCLAGGIFLMQGILTLSGKGKAMQLASCVSAVGGSRHRRSVGVLPPAASAAHAERLRAHHLRHYHRADLRDRVRHRRGAVLPHDAPLRGGRGPQMVRRPGYRRVAGAAVRDGRLLPDERHSRVGHHAAASVLRGGHGDAGRSGRHDHRRAPRRPTTR